MRILFWMFIVSMGLFANAVEFSDEEKEWIEKNNPIPYVGDPSWLPFEAFDRDGKYVGIVSDILLHVEKTTPLRFKIIKTASWDESIEIMKKGKAMLMSQSQDYNKQTDQLFTRVYCVNPIVIVMNKESRFVASLYDIGDKKIALSSSSAFFHIVKDSYPDFNFHTVSSTREGVESVVYGENDAFVNTLAQTSYEMAKSQQNNLRIVGKTEFSTQLGFGVSRDNAILQKIMNKALDSISASSQNKILSKWIHQKYVEKINYTALYIALAIFSFIMIMGVMFYLKVKKETNAKLEAQNKMLEQQTKMAAMGEMLDATAHQWKQPLNALSMYLDLMENDFDDGLVDKAYLKEFEDGMHTQITHMTDTLTEFRNFFRPNTKIEDFNLLDTVNSVLLLTKDEFLKNQITLHVEIEKDITLLGNSNEFKHLILNIINNSKDAFNENNIKNREIYIRGFEKNNLQHIEIQDNAGGIPPHVIDNVFEANFTTKDDGKGTGIGLYMSFQIVKKMGGEIDVKNIEDGAIFEIEISENNAKIA